MHTQPRWKKYTERYSGVKTNCQPRQIMGYTFKKCYTKEDAVNLETVPHIFKAFENVISLFFY